MMSPTVDALRKIAFLVENDLDALGWDQPARLYAVGGMAHDPILEFMFEVEGHPVQELEAIWDAGIRLRENVLGLALACEGWRHLDLQELKDSAPSLIQEITEAQAQKPGEGHALTQEEQEELVKMFHRHLIGAVPPSALPPSLRRETRQITIVMRDASTVCVTRTRGHDAEDWTDWQVAGRVPDALVRTLYGEHPTEGSPVEGTCELCHACIRRDDHNTWIDKTGGDICEDDKPHVLDPLSTFEKVMSA